MWLVLSYATESVATPIFSPNVQDTQHKHYDQMQFRFAIDCWLFVDWFAANGHGVTGYGASIKQLARFSAVDMRQEQEK